jgi:hypothetical protein
MEGIHVCFFALEEHSVCVAGKSGSVLEWLKERDVVDGDTSWDEWLDARVSGLGACLIADNHM